MINLKYIGIRRTGNRARMEVFDSARLPNEWNPGGFEEIKSTRIS